MTRQDAARVDLARLPGHDGLYRLFDLLPEARLVGGSVRDLLCGHRPDDLDLATPEPPERVLAILQGASVRAVPTGLAHGTITAVIAGRPYEITTLRRDDQTDGRHAVVSWTADWREDAARRDFTINALSCSRDGQVHDYFDGVRDLARHRVRFVGDPAVRIEEDALRILRFFRFTARFGAGSVCADALAVITAHAYLVATLSRERVASELLRLLAGPNVVAMLRTMDACGVLTHVVVTDAASIARLERLIACGGPDDPVLRLAALANDAARAGRALRLSNAQIARLEAATAHGANPPVPGWDEHTLRRALFATAPQTLLDRSWLEQGANAQDDPDAWNALRARITTMPRPVFPLSGRDAVAAGVPPGPRIGAILRDVEAWWMRDGCRADRSMCMARLREIAARDADGCG